MTLKLTLPFVKEAVNELVDFVKVTYGPAQNKVILTDGDILAVLDDGVSIAEQYKTGDPYKDAVIRLVVEVAKRTNRRVGDGTTGSLILVKSLLEHIDEKTDTEDLIKAKDEAVQKLRARATKIESEEDLRKVAYMAYRNKPIADLVANVVYKLGEEAIVSIEESPNLETTHSFEEGIQFDRGFLSPYMITDTRRMEAVWEDSPILITDRKIQHIGELAELCNKLNTEGIKKLVVIANDYLGDTLPTIASNIMAGGFKILAVKAPGFAHRMRDLLEDMAVVTGAEVAGADTDTPFEEFRLGRAERVVATPTKTIIVNGGGSKEDTLQRVAGLQEELKSQPTDFDKARISERIARLTTGVAIIKVGAPTESEMKAIKYKIEDSINAAKAALKGGIVLGGGKTIGSIKTSSDILNEAFRQPTKVLKENGGKLEEVYDPVDVIIASIESAVSIAVLLKDSKGIIVRNA